MSKPGKSKASVHLGPGDAFYWEDGETFVGGNRNDCITVHGDCNTAFGGNGNDRITLIGDRNLAFGGNGKDILVACGDWNRLDGGNGSDNLTVRGDNNRACGGNGTDVLLACGDRNWLDGGNGSDNLTVRGDNNRAFGGNGADCLVAIGEGNRLSGGSGADRLTSVSCGERFEAGQGNVLTGGQGLDVFVLRNKSDLRVVNDERDHGTFALPFGEGVVSRGDVIRGVMDEITDYRAGERIVIGAKQEVRGPVGLDDFAPDHKHLELADGEYAFIRGDLVADGTFRVDRCGGDLLLVYDASGGGDALFLQGAVVLHGVTDPDSVFVC